MLAGAVLLTGPFLGFSLMAGVLVSTFRRAEERPYPVPEEIASAAQLGQHSLFVGLGVGLIGALILTIALLRLSRLGAALPDLGGSEPWR